MRRRTSHGATATGAWTTGPCRDRVASLHRAPSPLLPGLLLVLSLLSACHRAPRDRAASSPLPATPVPQGEGAAPEVAAPEEPADDASADQDTDGAAGDVPSANEPANADAPTRSIPAASGVGAAVPASFRAPLVIPKDSPAKRLAALSPAQCMKELAARKLPFTRSKQVAAGVATPLRSTGPLSGVRIVIPRAPSLFGVLDCRAALALDELASVLAAHDVVEVQVDNSYRPKAHLPGKKATRSQHAYGLALDVTRVRLKDGTSLEIERDWHATIGDTSCGPEATMTDPNAASIALRDIVCDVARRGIFHHILSPSWDAAHRNHLHLDIQRNASRQAMH